VPLSSTTLAAVSRAIAAAAGLPVDAVSLYENPDGSFTAPVYGVEHTGTFEAVLAWTDLRSAFPEMKGFSPRKLKYMRAFAESWPESEVVQGVLAQLSWYHQVALLDKLKDPVSRTWYAKAAIEYGWSRSKDSIVLQPNTDRSAALNFIAM